MSLLSRYLFTISFNFSSIGYLLKKTIEKEDRLKELGYNLVSIWESEYSF
jgi:hypothetical protein